MRLQVNRELRSESEVAETRHKISILEEAYEEVRGHAAADEWDQELRGAELESLHRLINQLKEEIARYEANQPAAR